MVPVLFVGVAGVVGDGVAGVVGDGFGCVVGIGVECRFFCVVSNIVELSQVSPRSNCMVAISLAAFSYVILVFPSVSQGSPLQPSISALSTLHH